MRSRKDRVALARVRADAKGRSPAHEAHDDALSRIRVALPALFTLANLACGFLSIVLVLQDRFEHKRETMYYAAVLILVGMTLDVLDGLVARLTRGTSDFGVQLDSLADLLTAGVAPALLVYSLFIHDRGFSAGVVAPLWFALAVALRLARFNVSTKDSDPRYFAGLPAPAGGGILAAFVVCYFGIQQGASNVVVEWLRTITPIVADGILVLTVVLGMLMVSRIPYRAAKKADWSRLTPKLVVLVVVLGLLSIAAYPPMVFPCFVLFGISGPAIWVARLFGYGRPSNPAVA